MPVLTACEQLAVALRAKSREDRDTELLKWAGDESMEKMFQDDYEDAIAVAGHIEDGNPDRALTKIDWMDTAARDEVGTNIYRLDPKYYAEHLVPHGWVENPCRYEKSSAT